MKLETQKISIFELLIYFSILVIMTILEDYW